MHTGTSYEAESGTIGGSAINTANSAFSGGRYVGFLGMSYSTTLARSWLTFILGNGGTVSLNVQGAGADQWVALYYANGDSTWRNMTISVNGGSTIWVDQPNTGSGNTILSVPVKLHLNSGSNTILFAAGQTSASVLSYSI